MTDPLTKPSEPEKCGCRWGPYEDDEFKGHQLYEDACKYPAAREKIATLEEASKHNWAQNAQLIREREKLREKAEKWDKGVAEIRAELKLPRSLKGATYDSGLLMALHLLGAKEE